MSKPLTIPKTFGAAVGTASMGDLDTDFSAIAAAINDPSTLQNYGADTGAANAYVVNLSPAATALTTGMQIQFLPNNSNTGASTINVNGLGVVNLLSSTGVALNAGQVRAGNMVFAWFDGAAFRVINEWSGRILIKKASVANAATLDVTGIPTGFSVIECWARGVFPITAGQNLLLRISQAASFKSDANYSYAAMSNLVNAPGTFAGSGATGATQWLAGLTAINNTAGINGVFRFMQPIGGGAFPTYMASVMNFDNPTSGVRNLDTKGIYVGAAAEIDGIRILSASGNITGTLEVWGIVP